MQPRARMVFAAVVCGLSAAAAPAGPSVFAGGLAEIDERADAASAAHARKHIAPAAWTHFAGGPERISTIARTIGSLGAPEWVVTETDSGEDIFFLPSAGVVTTPDLVLAVGIVGFDDALVAVDRKTGSVAWTAPMPIAVNDSWSTPATDLVSETAIVASGAALTAVDLATGAVAWQTPLAGAVVNASPMVTTDLGARDRAFITDSSPVGAGRLYAVNIDPFDATHNPHAPGEIVWSVTLPGATSGNTPAYRDRVVYISTAGGSGSGGGTIAAYDATADSTPPPMWVYQHAENNGFFGGVSMHGGSVYACTYDFGFGRFNASLVRVRAHDGGLVWSAPCERTDAVPVPLADGRLVVSAGIAPDQFFGDFGSRPCVLVYDDAGGLLWDSASATWDDLNGNDAIDAGEYLPIGGWTSQPIVVDQRGSVRPVFALVTRSIPETDGSFFDGVAGLSLIDLDAAAMGLPFEVDATNAGSWSPAATAGWVYSAGPNGLAAFKDAHP